MIQKVIRGRGCSRDIQPLMEKLGMPISAKQRGFFLKA